MFPKQQDHVILDVNFPNCMSKMTLFLCKLIWLRSSRLCQEADCHREGDYSCLTFLANSSEWAQNIFPQPVPQKNSFLLLFLDPESWSLPQNALHREIPVVSAPLCRASAPAGYRRKLSSSYSALLKMSLLYLL